MKLTFKSLAILMISIVVFYTACKNNNTPQPASQAVTADMVSSQVALNIAQSLSGSYGGVSLQSGMSAPAFATKGANHTVTGRFNSLNSVNTLCGFTVDTVLNFNSSIDTIQSHTGGSIYFYFNCTNGVSTGYTAKDSIRTAGTTPSTSFNYTIVQNYQITSNTAITLLSVNGNLRSEINIAYNNTKIKPTLVHNYYVLNGIVVDLTKGGDMTGGTATFTSTGHNNYGSWTYNGVITFLGNHMADILINGKTYHANLLTGVVS
ncbi:MAG: hypothetical protein JWQ63_2481 [Mucilaginibacter sp.]|nr:hypothetical protein [Mucilaginibacter sp.]